MVEAGKSRCILYFDELDKACSKHGQVNEILNFNSFNRSKYE